MENKKPFAWWRYPVAIILLLLCVSIIPIIVSVIMSLMQIITPPFFQSGFGWITLVSDVAGVIIGFSVVEQLMKETHYVFQAVLAAIVGALLVFVALYNWRVFGVATDSDLFGVIGVLGSAVTAFVFVGISCKKNANQLLKEMEDLKK